MKGPLVKERYGTIQWSLDGGRKTLNKGAQPYDHLEELEFFGGKIGSGGLAQSGEAKGASKGKDPSLRGPGPLHDEGGSLTSNGKNANN